jgi:hypothetical protein
MEIGIPFRRVSRVKPDLIIELGDPNSTAQLSVLHVVTSMNAYACGFLKATLDITPRRRYVVFRSKYVSVE